MHSCVLSLWMDYLGKDGTINHIDAEWVNPHITVPIAIIALIASIVVYAKEQRKEGQVIKFFDYFLSSKEGKQIWK